MIEDIIARRSTTLRRLDGIADSHNDSMVVPLRPGLMLLRDPDIIPAVPMAESASPTTAASASPAATLT